MPGNPERRIAVVRWLLLIPTLVFVIAAGVALTGTLLQLGSGDGRRPGVRNLAVIARESIGRILILLIGPFGRIETAPRAHPTEEKHTPVLMLPGYGTNRMVFWFLRQYLEHRGWRWVWPVNHAGKQTALQGQAKALGRHVAELKRASGSEKVDLIGFSMGGLIAAWYVAHGGSDDVRRLITVGSPWGGSRLAGFLNTPVGEQMKQDSEALRSLDATLVPTTAIWSPDDPVVVPASSAVPSGAVSVQVDGAGHLDLMMNGRAFRAVQQALTT